MDETPEGVYALIEDHLQNSLSGWVSTKFEHSYDVSSGVFRFDMRPQGKLIELVQH